MLEGTLSLISSARVGFIGLYRDEQTLEPVEYYVKLPDDLGRARRDRARPDARDREIERGRDPEGQGAGARWGVTLVCLVAAPPGIERVHEEHPDVHIVCAAVDRGLNERGFIVPGLGDAGDRSAGTESTQSLSPGSSLVETTRPVRTSRRNLCKPRNPSERGQSPFGECRAFGRGRVEPSRLIGCARPSNRRD